jgi:hypothetical protein
MVQGAQRHDQPVIAREPPWPVGVSGDMMHGRLTPAREARLLGDPIVVSLKLCGLVLAFRAKG